MRKNLFMSFSLFLTLVLLAGCGKSEPSTTEYVPDGSNYEGEGEVQGGIKSDKELAALEEEASADTSTTDEVSSTTEDASYVDNSGHEPESYGSGNFQDYWQGDDFFDIVAYAQANGCSDIRYFDEAGSPTKEESEANAYRLFFDNNNWQIYSFSTGIYLTYMGEKDSEGHTTMSPQYSILTPSTDGSYRVSLSKKNNASLTIECLTALDTVVNAVKNNSNNLDPLANTNLDYSKIQ